MAATAIIFDLDDTLVPEKEAVPAALIATCERARAKYGVEAKVLYQAVIGHARQLWLACPTLEYCRGVGISPWEGLTVRFTGDDPHLRELCLWAPGFRLEAWRLALGDHGVDDATLAGELAAIFYDERRTRHALYPDVVGVLQELRPLYRLALLTNGAPDLQWEKIKATGLAPYFDPIVIAGEVGIGKPHPQIFAEAIARLAIAPAAAVMVGDSLVRDVGGAHQAGLRAIWVNRAGSARDGTIVPDAEIASLRELPAVVGQG